MVFSYFILLLACGKRDKNGPIGHHVILDLEGADGKLTGVDNGIPNRAAIN